MKEETKFIIKEAAATIFLFAMFYFLTVGVFLL